MSSGGAAGRRGCSGRLAITNRHVRAQLDFLMPLDLDQVAYIRVCGQDFYLEE